MKKYNLLLPIAGKAQRFINAGYTMPKPLILAKNRQIIDWSLSSIDYSECNLIFIVQLEHIYNFGIDEILKQKFGDDIQICVVNSVTRGALETCVLAEKYIDPTLPLYIYTPDVYFEPVFDPASVADDVDGFLLTFLANSPDHSYCEIDDNGVVSRVAEKQVISRHANVGLYYFKSVETFLKYGKYTIDNNLLVKNEFYIAPMYNLMVDDGLKVVAQDTEKMHVLGTPETFEFFCKHVLARFGDKPIALASDHSGFLAKQMAKKVLSDKNIPFIDVGTHVNKQCDYYDYVEQSIELIQDGTCDFGISFCRSGQGVNIAASHADGIISALTFDEFTAEHAIRHNCANHFSVPEKYVDEETFTKMVNAWTNTTFDGGRHFTRLNKVLKKC
jgi:RpiB/LacA/LacB family sugar-phosphate isomerase